MLRLERIGAFQQPMEMPVGMLRGGMQQARGAEGTDPGDR
jgi:hypothetical protein